MTIAKPYKDTSTPLKELIYESEMQVYILDRIQKVKKDMENLAVELMQECDEAAFMVRDMVYKMREIEMTYLTNSRKKIKIISDKITMEMVFPPKQEENEFNRIFNPTEPTKRYFGDIKPTYYKGTQEEWENESFIANKP